jgi:hypothetical protein
MEQLEIYKTGDYKFFDNQIENLIFEKRIGYTAK